jgi:hypothetical protein
MTDVDLAVGFQDGGEPGHRAPHGAGAVTAQPADVAAWAAKVTAEQALSVFDAVAASAEEIDAQARREAVELRLRTRAATAAALGRLVAIDGELGALVAELRRQTDERAARWSHGR